MARRDNRLHSASSIQTGSREANYDRPNTATSPLHPINHTANAEGGKAPNEWQNKQWNEFSQEHNNRQEAIVKRQTEEDYARGERAEEALPLFSTWQAKQKQAQLIGMEAEEEGIAISKLIEARKNVSILMSEPTIADNPEESKMLAQKLDTIEEELKEKTNGIEGHRPEVWDLLKGKYKEWMAKSDSLIEATSMRNEIQGRTDDELNNNVADSRTTFDSAQQGFAALDRAKERMLRHPSDARFTNGYYSVRSNVLAQVEGLENEEFETASDVILDAAETGGNNPIMSAESAVFLERQNNETRDKWARHGIPSAQIDAYLLNRTTQFYTKAGLQYVNSDPMVQQSHARKSQIDHLYNVASFRSLTPAESEQLAKLTKAQEPLSQKIKSIEGTLPEWTALLEELGYDRSEAPLAARKIIDAQKKELAAIIAGPKETTEKNASSTFVISHVNSNKPLSGGTIQQGRRNDATAAGQLFDDRQPTNIAIEQNTTGGPGEVQQINWSGVEQTRKDLDKEYWNNKVRDGGFQQEPLAVDKAMDFDGMKPFYINDTLIGIREEARRRHPDDSAARHKFVMENQNRYIKNKMNSEDQGDFEEWVNSEEADSFRQIYPGVVNIMGKNTSGGFVPKQPAPDNFDSWNKRKGEFQTSGNEAWLEGGYASFYHLADNGLAADQIINTAWTSVLDDYYNGKIDAADIAEGAGRKELITEKLEEMVYTASFAGVEQSVLVPKEYHAQLDSKIDRLPQQYPTVDYLTDPVTQDQRDLSQVLTADFFTSNVDTDEITAMERGTPAYERKVSKLIENIGAGERKLGAIEAIKNDNGQMELVFTVVVPKDDPQSKSGLYATELLWTGIVVQ